jgi:thiol-disulfide isomerase/thioredoxin
MGLMRTMLTAGVLATAWIMPLWGDDQPQPNPAPTKVVLDVTGNALMGKVPPALTIDRWVNGEALAWSALADRTVVIVFWEVWSAGSRKVCQQLAALHQRHAAAGLVIIAVHPGEENAEHAVARAAKFPFRVALDRQGQTALAWSSTRRVPEVHIVVGGKIAFAAVDTTIAGNLELAIQHGLAGHTSESYYTIPERIAPPKISSMLDDGAKGLMQNLGDKPAPALNVAQWVQGELDLAALQGKVVLIDFWGTWCGPCVAALPKLVALHEKYKDRGLVIIGIHTTNAAENLPGFLTQHALPYSLAIDREDATVKAYGIRAFPSLVMIGKDGKVAAARIGLASDLEAVLVKLLDAPAPGQPEAPQPPEAPESPQAPETPQAPESR